MNKSLLRSCLLLFATLLFVGCGDDGNGEPVDKDVIVINNNGTTSTGASYVRIDDKNFYLDYIKYTVEEAHLVVSGYDKTGGNSVNIATSIRFKSNLYHVNSIGNNAFFGCSDVTSMPSRVVQVLPHSTCLPVLSASVRVPLRIVRTSPTSPFPVG